MKNLLLPIRYGLAMSGCLIAYFLILALLKWHTNPVFSLFNAVIVGSGIYDVIKRFKLQQGNNFTYTDGFSTGLVAGFVATVVFTVFFLFYATEVNTAYIDRLLIVFKGDYNVSVGLVTSMVAVMGAATTVIITLTCMQLFKNSRNIK